MRSAPKPPTSPPASKKPSWSPSAARPPPSDTPNRSSAPTSAISPLSASQQPIHPHNFQAQPISSLIASPPLQSRPSSRHVNLISSPPLPICATGTPPIPASYNTMCAVDLRPFLLSHHCDDPVALYMSGLPMSLPPFSTGASRVPRPGLAGSVQRMLGAGSLSFSLRTKRLGHPDRRAADSCAGGGYAGAERAAA